MVRGSINSNSGSIKSYSCFLLGGCRSGHPAYRSREFKPERPLVRTIAPATDLSSGLIGPDHEQDSGRGFPLTG